MIFADLILLKKINHDYCCSNNALNHQTYKYCFNITKFDLLLKSHTYICLYFFTILNILISIKQTNYISAFNLYIL
jgi:hypothetical protein